MSLKISEKCLTAFFPIDPYAFIFNKGATHEVWWQNGYASDCKSAYVGSIPAQTSSVLPYI